MFAVLYVIYQYNVIFDWDVFACQSQNPLTPIKYLDLIHDQELQYYLNICGASTV